MMTDSDTPENVRARLISHECNNFDSILPENLGHQLKIKHFCMKNRGNETQKVVIVNPKFEFPISTRKKREP
jgi:hypothetical protein